MSNERDAIQQRTFELGMPYVDIERVVCHQGALNSLSSELARTHHILPVKMQDQTLWVAVGRPNDIRAVEVLTEATGCRIIPVLAQIDALEAAIKRHYKIE